MISSDVDKADINSQRSSGAGPLAAIIGLARLSRVTLLYHGPMPADDGAEREQAAALLAAASGGEEVCVLFDAASDLPLPDLLADIETAVLEARPQAPLAPPMADAVEALAFWQEALQMRFLLIFHRFEAALAKSDPEFDSALLRLVRDPALDVSLLLMMDEAAAPLLDRLRDDIPDLGEDYLRMPEPAPLASAPASTAQPAPTQAPDVPAERDALPETALHLWEAGPATMSPEHGDRPDATGDAPAPTPDDVTEDQRLQRRRRSFSNLLEQASNAPVPQDASEFEPDDFAEFRWPAQDAEPVALAGASGPDALFASQEPQAAATPHTAPQHHEPLPLPVAACMQKRLRQRRRATLAITASTGFASTILFFFMLMLGLLSWELPQLPGHAAAPAAVRALNRSTAAAAPERYPGAERRLTP
jgi:hypothetical protein